MIERPMIPAAPRLRAGTQPQPAPETPRHWMQDRAPSFRSLARDRQRREQVWSWLSLIVLLICWDTSSRLGERVSPPRARVAHVMEEDEVLRPSSGFSVDL